MKFLLTHRFFWPDTAPYALLLRAIGDDLAANGHDVNILTSKPSYRSDTSAPSREKLGALSVRRVWVMLSERDNVLKRIANVLIYCIAIFIHVRRVRPDVVTASSYPPVLAAWCVSLAAKSVGARFIYHMQDIHPEVSQISGTLMGRGPLLHLLRWLDCQTLRRSAAIVVLSEDMAAVLRDRSIRDLPIHVINNFALDSFGESSPPPEDLCKPNGTRRVIFAGNLGRYQNLPALAAGVMELLPTHPDVELFFLGDGHALADLKTEFGHHPQVKFGPFLPFGQARELIADSDVGLVSLSPGIYRVAYPSKVMTYLGLGIPILALVEPESALAANLVAGSVGVVPANDTPDAIASALSELLAEKVNPKVLQDWYEDNAGRDRFFAAWQALVNAV